MIGRGRVRAIDRDDVHAGEHLVEALPIGGVELFLDARRDAAAIVIVDLQAERLGAPGDRLADAAHADDAEPLAPDAVTEHPGRRPAGPFAPPGRTCEPSTSRRGTARISAIVMSAVSSVRTPGVLVTVMPRCSGGRHVDIVDAVAEIGDELQLLAGLARGVRRRSDRSRSERSRRRPHGLGELDLAHRLVVEIEPCVEQLAHAGFDDVRQFAGDDNERLFA